MLRCYDVTAACGLSPCTERNEAVSHGITATFGVQLGVPLYTERNETAFGVLLDTERNRAVKSWNNGRVWCSSMY